MSATITYKGATLTTAENQTRTLKTAGKYLEDDITVVDVTSGGSAPVLQSQTKSYTPTETAQSETVTADAGYDGLSQVAVSVGAIPSQYIVPTGTKSITANGTGIDVAAYAAVDVAVPSVNVEALSVTANGTYTAPTGTAYSPVTVNVPSGGGASNVVTGTFKGTTTGAAMDVNIPYTGDGYPIAVWIYPSEGSFNPNGTFYSLIQRYAVDAWAGVKCLPAVVPYTGSTTGRNDMTNVFRYKTNAVSANSYSNSGSSNATVFQDAAATSSSNNIVRFRTSKKMSVFIAETSYGFAANIEYTYHIIYSS